MPLVLRVDHLAHSFTSLFWRPGFAAMTQGAGYIVARLYHWTTLCARLLNLAFHVARFPAFFSQIFGHRHFREINPFLSGHECVPVEVTAMPAHVLQHPFGVLLF